MAFQFDGDGYITIPEAVAGAVWSVVFDSVLITSDSPFGMIAGHTSSSFFMGVKSTNNISARIDHNNIDYEGALGQTVKVEIKADATTKTLLVDDVVVGTAAASINSEFKLDKFGAYLNESLKYSGIVSGNVTFTGFIGGDRRYNFDGEVGDTTLIDEISAQNGTFSGFTSGGFLPASGGVQITSVANGQFKLKDESGNATFTIAGTTTATSPSIIEYSKDSGSTWLTLDLSPNGSTFSGGVVISGETDIVVRISDTPTTTDSVSGLRVTDINILFWGQSNEVSRNANQHTIAVGEGKPTPLKYTPENGSFSVASDPTGMGNGVIGGSTASLIAQKYSDAGVSVGIVNVAEGGSSLLQWQKGTSFYTRITNAADVVGGLTLTTCIIGETDAGNGTTEADAIARMTAICQDIFTDFGVSTYISYFVDASGTGTPENILNIRNAYDSVIANNDFAKFGGDTGLIDTGGNIHMTTAPQFATLSQLRYDAQQAGLSPSSTLNMTSTNTPSGTYSADIYNYDTKTLIETRNITFSGGDASESIPLDIGSEVLVFIEGDSPPVTGLAYIGATE